MASISKLSKPFIGTLCLMGLLISSIAAGCAGRIGSRFVSQAPSASVQPETHGYGVYVYPKAGQSEQQQARDKSECHQWAVSETGFDPNTAPPVTSETPPQPPPGIAKEAIGMVGTGGLAKGAGVGEGIGLAAGNPYGAAIGAGRAIIKRHREDEQKYQEQLAEEQQEMQQRQSQLQAYQGAYSACMSGRDYSVGPTE